MLVSTPYLLGLKVESESDRLAEEYRVALSMAWYGAAFERSKKLPKLADVMPDRAPKVVQFTGTRIDTAVIKRRFQKHREQWEQEHAKAG